MFHHKPLDLFRPLPWQALIAGMIAANAGTAFIILDLVS